MSRSLPVAILLLIAALSLARPPADEKLPAWHEVLPARELDPLARQITAALKKPIEALVSGKLDEDDRERAVKKGRGMALLLAAGAQATESKGGVAARRGPISNAALQLDVALRTGKFAAAKAVLAALPTGTGFEKPAFTAAALITAQDRDDAVTALMTLCRLRVAGGLGVEPPRAREEDGLEVMLKLVSNNRDGLKPEDLARYAYCLAVLAEATHSMPPPPRPGKDPAKWLQWAADMRSASVELANAAGKNRAAIRQAALKIGRSCHDCHRMFRD